jgi:lysophospholipase L1-like esterase
MGRRRALLACVAALMSVAVVSGPAGAADEAPSEPLRVLLVGDSITASYWDDAAVAFRAKGYDVMVNAVGGSGLRDAWACHGRRPKTLRRWDADVVVYQSIGTYGKLPPCSPTLQGSPRFYRQWENEADAAQRILTRDGGRFLWVLNPQTNPARSVDLFNAIYLREGTEFVDAWSAFGGWTYNPSLHIADGVHLNQDGQRLLAELVVAAVG